jgi:dipeptidyl aminopeptidase/acylaminoacyl peptidase
MSPPRTAADLTPEHLVDLELPSQVKISPDGKFVAYTVKPASRTGEHTKSALWLADINVEHSARQLTSALFEDRSPQWSPDGKGIAFLSDRGKVGKACAIFLLSLAGGEPYPLTSAKNERPISMFKWSPDGHSIAFLSADEKSEERKRKETEKDDVKVYGKEWDFARLRLLHVKTRQTDMLVQGEFHCANFAWKSDSRQIAYTLHQTPELDSPGYHGIHFHVKDLIDHGDQLLLHFPGPINGEMLWKDENILMFLAGVSIDHSCTSLCLYTLLIDEAKAYPFPKYDHEHDIMKLCGFATESGGIEIMVKIQHGLEDRLEAPDLIMYEGNPVIFRDETDILDFDAAWPADDLVLVLVMSSPSSPWEVFSVTHQYQKWGQNMDNAVQISSHSASIAALSIAIGESFHCKAVDDSHLDAVFFKPSTVSSETPELPTVVMIHGGPYTRTTHTWDPMTNYGWLACLTAAGYGVLCPNYRGGSSHGEKWSSAARGRMGREDYTDIIRIVTAAIEVGLVHPEKVVVAGWSQGGFLSYISAVRKSFPFKGTICGAGVSDWDTLTLTSDIPWFEAELAGAAPWAATEPKDTSARHGSPLWHMKFTEPEDRTPVLILHGEEDKRIPVSQAISFHRGCLALKWPCDLAVYPREEHRFVERAHMIDMLKRVRRFCDFYLN